MTGLELAPQRSTTNGGQALTAEAGRANVSPACGRLRVLSLSCTYPNPLQAQLGTFVRSRLESLSAVASVVVVAPVALLEFGNRARSRFRVTRISGQSTSSLEVWHPRWFYPPLGGALNAFFLFVQMLPVVWRVRQGFQFDILDAHFGFPDGITAALIAAVFRCPFSITLRGNEPMHAEYFFRRHALRWAIRRADSIIAVSERLREFAIACGARPQKVRTIPNGIDTAVFYPRDREAARRQFNLPLDSRVVLSAGSLIERKGHHRVIEAVRNLRLRGAGTHLVIAGGPGAEGGCEQMLHRLVEEVGLGAQVRFTGPLAPELLAQLMSAADVLCLASTREGSPNVVNEALACGTPVVATDVGGVPDMLPGSEYGFVIPAGNQAALDHAIEQALTKSWDRQAIFKWGQSRSWQQVAIEVLQQLTQTVNGVN